MLKRIFEVITALLASAFVIFGTVIVYFYAKGYRLDPSGRDVRETGVINLESNPSRADIYIENVKTGRTPRTTSSIDEGFVNVKLKKDSYYNWEKALPVFREKSSSISAELFLKQAKAEKIADIPGEINSLLVSQNNQHFIYTTKDNNKSISIWKYDLDRNFWDLSNNPHLIATITTSNIKTFKLYSSPDSGSILVQYEQQNSTKKTVFKSTLFNTDQVDSKGTDIDLSKFKDSYSISWSNSEGYLMLESESDIISFNINTKVKYLVYKKSSKEKLVWNTDSLNNMYYLTNSSDESGNYQSLEQISLEGTNSKTLIPRIYSQTSDTYINALKSEVLDYQPFTNSPISTKFIGKITNFFIDQTTKGIFLSTDKAAYWYQTDTDKYVLIHTSPAEVMSVSENKQMILFKDLISQDLHIYTFDKEKNDPVAQIGSVMIVKADDSIGTMEWMTESNLLFSLNGTIYSIDKDGDNINEMKTQTTPLLYSATSAKYIHTIELIDQKPQIIKYTVQ